MAGTSRPAALSACASRAKTSRGAPSRIAFPSCMAMTRSPRSASSMKCVTSTTVSPLSRWSRSTVSMTSRRPPGSSMAVGSSMSSTSGSMARAPAMATRCFCPPESMCGALAAYFCMPTARSAASTRSRISCGFTPRFSRPKATSSSTIVATIWLSGF